MSLPPAFVKNFQRESWVLYGTGIAVIATRMAAQFYRQRRFRADDLCMMSATVWYTVLIVALNKIVGGGGTNYMTPEVAATLTPASIRSRIQGAKWVFVTEQALMATIWSMKGCMLIIYARLTEGLEQRRYINWLTIYTFGGYIITQICIFSICRPFLDYFAVPPLPGKDECVTYYKYLIVQCVFNVTSDFSMLLIGIPLLLTVKVPFQQKIGVIIVFSMGMFVIVAAILNKLYSTLPSLLNDSLQYTHWYIREATVAVYVINLPTIWPVLCKAFPVLRGKGSFNVSRLQGMRTWHSALRRPYTISSQNDPGTKSQRLTTAGEPERGSTEKDREDLTSHDSNQQSNFQEGIAKGGFYNGSIALEIKHDVTFTIEHQNRDPELPIRQSGTDGLDRTSYVASVETQSRRGS